MKPSQPFRTSVEFYDRAPLARGFGTSALLIYDRKLLKAVPEFSRWANGFVRSWPVGAGESLKDIAGFPAAAQRLAKLASDIPPRELTIVAAGGGSVGDFAGFLASVYKRGVDLVHVPTTWLVAIDSAHGGKTALNLGGEKNQIGTFYPARRSVLIKSYLLAQPDSRATEGIGELAKIALLGSRSAAPRIDSQSAAASLWKALPNAIAAKLAVVDKDPREASGWRQVLNLGHTLGHALESALEIPHGAAVAQGLGFAIEWSRHRRYLGAKTYSEMRSYLEVDCGLDVFGSCKDLRISAAALQRSLRADKKRAGSGAVFIFLEGWGKPRREIAAFAQIASEAKRQGRLK